MLFNLSCSRHFPTKQSGGGEILTKSNKGPHFFELNASAEPFNGNENCISEANNTAYAIPADADGLNMLTNKKDGWFTISELEVWEVTYL